ncbi:P-loop containing nucleoside triphosphate hydrolase protein [Myriangium duriaei CBS 260.36]|uniref:Signal recognition particle receptor subunit beta n=1 Tax=Myriangium duriaei CBS 260.36 TaxID=1168546 RepID=A0A9P4IUK4_9PEZI|nr:P-loop containing nucleoside triphosphate hydrolase protein [Myriangium duriaei CBS 260.36]
MSERSTTADWLTWALSPSASAIVITFLVAILSPIALHLYLYRSRARSSASTFLLLGSSGAGKTTLATLLQGGQPSKTHTSQEPQTIECYLPGTIEALSQGYRSQNDPTVKAERKFAVIDTPGHGKLRHHAIASLEGPESKELRGIIFVVDSAAISSPTGLTETATYLHDLLLLLQKRRADAKSSKGPVSLPILIAANKLDLFTALPAQLVRKYLEDEITNVRTTRAKGLLDSGVGMDDQGEEREWLGEGGDGPFKFGHMAESDIDINVVGGNVVGEKGQAGEVNEWWAWIADNM